MDTTCNRCNGTGEVRNTPHGMQDCLYCGGTGRMSDEVRAWFTGWVDAVNNFKDKEASREQRRTLTTCRSHEANERPEFPMYYDAQGREHESF